MKNPATALYEGEFQQIYDLSVRLLNDTNSKAVMLVDRNGRFLAGAGQVDQLDTTSLASLTAGNIAATGGLAQMIGEREFPHIYHEGEHDSLHLSIIGQYAILVVLFDERSSLGLVRLRVRKYCEQLARVFAESSSKAGAQGQDTFFSQITDDDIDNLFGT